MRDRIAVQHMKGRYVYFYAKTIKDDHNEICFATDDGKVIPDPVYVKSLGLHTLTDYESSILTEYNRNIYDRDISVVKEILQDFVQWENDWRRYPMLSKVQPINSDDFIIQLNNKYKVERR